jgi:hypothetical protein
MLKVAAVIGTGILGVLIFWGLVLIAVPNVPQQPPGDKTSMAPSTPEPKLRDVTAQPRITTIPATQPVATIKPALQPEPVVPTPVATASMTPSPMSAGVVESPQGPDLTPVASDPAHEPGGTEQPPPLGRQSHAANCTGYKTYNAATQSYRGFDGAIHPCRL